jgi:hypothetical protein
MYICMYVFVCMCVCMCIYVCVCVCVYIYIYICIYIYIYIYICTEGRKEMGDELHLNGNMEGICKVYRRKN